MSGGIGRSVADKIVELRPHVSKALFPTRGKKRKAKTFTGEFRCKEKPGNPQVTSWPGPAIENALLSLQKPSRTKGKFSGQGGPHKASSKGKKNDPSYPIKRERGRAIQDRKKRNGGKRKRRGRPEKERPPKRNRKEKKMPGKKSERETATGTVQHKPSNPSSTKAKELLTSGKGSRRRIWGNATRRDPEGPLRGSEPDHNRAPLGRTRKGVGEVVWGEREENWLGGNLSAGKQFTGS